jgi:hypothetical protein
MSGRHQRIRAVNLAWLCEFSAQSGADDDENGRFSSGRTGTKSNLELLPVFSVHCKLR